MNTYLNTIFLLKRQAGSAKSRGARPNPQNEAGRATEIVEENSEEIHCPDRKATAPTG